MPHRLAIAATAAAALALAASAVASAPLPRKPVDVAFRKAELHAKARYPGSRISCSWQQQTGVYTCTIWRPGGTGYVQGKPGTALQSGSVEAVARFDGQWASTGRPSCSYQVKLGTSVAIVNVCRSGWQKRL